MENSSIIAYFVNGSSMEVSEGEFGKNAIEYILPDMRPPVDEFVITTKTEDGKTVTLSIRKNRISAPVK